MRDRASYAFALVSVAAVTERAFAGATPTHDNAFKLPLATRTLAGVLAEARSA